MEVIVEKDILSISYQLLTVRLDCQARHPKRCRHEDKCKFFKQGICAYKHDTLVNHGEKVNSLENENKRLKEENTILKHKINQEVSITEKLKSEIHDLNQAIKMKNELIDKLQESEDGSSFQQFQRK